jgi:hypothetical protein
MAQHKVFIEQPRRRIGNSDFRFVVYEDGEKVGELGISRGGIAWWPYKAKGPIKRGWPRFRRWIEGWD